MKNFSETILSIFKLGFVKNRNQMAAYINPCGHNKCKIQLKESYVYPRSRAFFGKYNTLNKI